MSGAETPRFSFSIGTVLMWDMRDKNIFENLCFFFKKPIDKRYYIWYYMYVIKRQ